MMFDTACDDMNISLNKDCKKFWSWANSLRPLRLCGGNPAPQSTPRAQSYFKWNL